MKNGIVYCRESRDDGGEKYERIETQRDILLEFCKKNHIQPIHVIMDDNESGSRFSRLDKVRRWIENEEIHVLVAKDASRIGRNQLESLEFIRFLEQHQIELLFESEQYDENLFGLFAWLNERRAREDGEKIRRVLRHKMEQGALLIKPPYGYRIIEKTLQIHSSEAKNVQTVFTLFLQGFGMTEIANRLDTQFPHQNWSCQKVSRILRNPVYCGTYQVGKTNSLGYARKRSKKKLESEWISIENHHPSIISMDVFNKASERLIGRRRIASHKYSGLLFCADCMAPMTHRERVEKASYYICSTYNHHGKAACSSHKIQETDLDALISDSILELFKTREGYWQEKTSVTSAEESQKDINRKIKRLDMQLEQLYNDRMLEGFPQFLFEKKLKEYHEQKVALLERLSQCKDKEVKAPAEIKITKELLHIIADRIEVDSSGTFKIYKN